MPTLREVKTRLRTVHSTRYWTNVILWGKLSVRLLISFVLVSLLITGQSAAIGDVSYGIRLASGLSTMSGTPIPNISDTTFNVGNELKSRIGYSVGVFAIFPIMNSVLFQPELTLRYHRTDAKSMRRIAPRTIFGDLTERMKLLYVEFPVLVKIRLSSGKRTGPSLFAGPAFALNVIAKNEFENSLLARFSSSVPEFDITNVNKTDVSLVIGGDHHFMLGTYNLFLDLRYIHSLKRTFHDIDAAEISSFSSVIFPDEIPIVTPTGDAPDLKNRAITLSLGLRL